MKHTTSRLLFAYWDQIRGERAAPERSEIEPGKIRHLLADTFVLARDDGETAFRLAGTRCEALFGRDLKSVTLTSLFARSDRAGMDELLRTVMNETSGVIAGLIGRTDAGTTLPLELILLPLRHRGQTRSRVLGALSPRTMPTWIGLFPVTSLTLGSVRVVHSTAASDDLPDAALERRRRFVVVDGGLAMI